MNSGILMIRSRRAIAKLATVCLLAVTAAVTPPFGAEPVATAAGLAPLPPGPAPTACSSGGTYWLWPAVTNGVGGQPCYLATRQSIPSFLGSMTGLAGQTISPGQTATFALTGTGGAPAAWLLNWNGFFDSLPLMRGADGRPANATSGYDTFFSIPPSLDDSGCYDAASGSLNGRFLPSCSVKVNKGPYYGTPGGQQMPWTVFTASVYMGTGLNTPRVTNSSGNPVWADTTSFIELPVFLQPSPYAGFGTTVNGSSVQFVDTTLSDLPIANWAWNFGDGTSGTGSAPTHAYSNPGTYNVSMIVTTNDGQTDTFSRSVTVTQGASIDLGVSISPANPVAGQTVTATYTVTNTGSQTVNSITVNSNASPSSVITPNGSVSPSSASATGGTSASFTQQFSYPSGGQATISATATGTPAGGGSVSTPTRTRVFGTIGSLTMTFTAAPSTLTLQPDATGEPIPQAVTATATVTNTGTGSATNVTLPTPVLTSPDSPVPVIYDPNVPVPSSNLGTIAPGTSKTLTYALMAQFQGVTTVTATVTGDVGTATPATVTQTAAVTVAENNPVTTTWAMDKRYDNPGDEAITTGDVNPADWGMSATYKVNNACPTNTTAEWSVGGTIIATSPLRSCKATFRRTDVDPFKLQVKVLRNGQQIGRRVDPLTPRDILVVSIGDSMSSGEGVKEGGVGWRQANCDRSSLGGTARSARSLEDYDAHSAVTFVHLACSGATAAKGLLGPYEGMRNGYEPPQIAFLKTLTKTRGIDALLMTIGINDSGFGAIAGHCFSVTNCPTKPINTDFPGQTMQQLITTRLNSLPQTYAQVAGALNRIGVDPANVHLLEYPDPLHNSVGGPADYTFANQHLEAIETAWLYGKYLVKLNQAGAAAAAANGWDRISGTQSAFRLHGLDDTTTDRWINSIGDSLSTQGDVNGTLHPNYVGHTAFGNIIFNSVKSKLSPNPAPDVDASPGDISAPSPRGIYTLQHGKPAGFGLPQGRGAGPAIPSSSYPPGTSLTVAAGLPNQETVTVVANPLGAPDDVVTLSKKLLYNHSSFESIDVTNTLSPSMTSDKFLYTTDAQRATTQMFLDGRTIAGDVGIGYLPTPGNVPKSVTFSIDGVVASTDTSAPFDLAGSNGIDTYLMPSTLLSDGIHTITALAKNAAGATVGSLSATVTVANGTAAQTIKWATSNTRSPAATLNGATVPATGPAFAFLTPNTTSSFVTGSKLRFVLDGVLLDTDLAAPYDVGDTAVVGVAAAMPTATRTRTTHTIAVTYLSPTGALITGPTAAYVVP